ncbi:FxsA family protein [Corynebacterium mayonis]|uniref:FxsA family protein n=1 Tax=Corynebacterium mayonis TaxID=3062461 RepID=UPI0031404CAA
MRLILLAYFLIEVLAFIGVSKVVGIGWAILAVFALSVLGGVVASATLRNSVARAAVGQGSLGRLAGDGAILVTGWALCILPGFVSSLLGLLLVFPPSRAVIRRALTAKTAKAVEEFGMKVYLASPMSQQRTSYGSFVDESQVVDAEELERWFQADSAGDVENPHGGGRGGNQGGQR